MLKRRQTEVAKIDDLAKRRVTFSKRRKGLFRKVSKLCQLTGIRAAIIVFSTTGRLYSFGDLSVEEIISEYLRCNDDVMPPMGLREWVDWVNKELYSCVTEEEFDSLIVKYEVVLDCVRKRLKELENNPSVKASASGDYGVGVDCNFELLDDDEIDSLLQSFKASRPLLFALFKDYVHHGECDSFLTLPVKSAAGGGSSGVKSTPVCSVLEGCAYNAASSGNSGVESIPTCSDLEGCGFNPEDFLNLSEDCIGDGDCGSFLALPENSADHSGSSGEEPMRSDLEGSGYNLDDFAALEDLDVSLDI